MDNTSQNFRQQILCYILKTSLLYHQHPLSLITSSAYSEENRKWENATRPTGVERVAQREVERDETKEREDSVEPQVDMEFTTAKEEEKISCPQKEPCITQQCTDLLQMDTQVLDFTATEYINGGDIILDFNLPLEKMPALEPEPIVTHISDKKNETNILAMNNMNEIPDIFKRDVAIPDETKNILIPDGSFPETKEGIVALANKIKQARIATYKTATSLSSSILEKPQYTKRSERAEAHETLLSGETPLNEQIKDSEIPLSGGEPLNEQKIEDPTKNNNLEEKIVFTNTNMNTPTEQKSNIPNVTIVSVVTKTPEVSFLVRTNKQEYAFASSEKEALNIISSLVAEKVRELDNPKVRVFTRDLADKKGIQIYTQNLGTFFNGLITRHTMIDVVPVSKAVLQVLEPQIVQPVQPQPLVVEQSK